MSQADSTARISALLNDLTTKYEEALEIAHMLDIECGSHNDGYLYFVRGIANDMCYNADRQANQWLRPKLESAVQDLRVAVANARSRPSDIADDTVDRKFLWAQRFDTQVRAYQGILTVAKAKYREVANEDWKPRPSKVRAARDKEELRTATASMTSAEALLRNLGADSNMDALTPTMNRTDGVNTSDDEAEQMIDVDVPVTKQRRLVDKDGNFIRFLDVDTPTQREPVTALDDGVPF